MATTVPFNPNNDNEGSIGTASKRYSDGHFVKLNTADLSGVGAIIFTTATQISTTINGSTSAVNPIAQTGRTIKIGDMVMSSNTNSNGYWGVVTAISSQTSVTVRTSGNIVFPTFTQIPVDFFQTTTAISTTVGNSTIAVNPTAQTGRTVAINDFVMSTNASSSGYLGRVTAVTSQASVTVTTIAALNAATVGGKTVDQITASIPGANLWVSSEYTPVANTPTIVTHGISGLNPLRAKGDVLLKCVVAEHGYSIGDFAINATVPSGNYMYFSLTPSLTSTTIQANTGSVLTGLNVASKTNGSGQNLTLANWRYIFRIWH